MRFGCDGAPMTIREALAWAVPELKAAGVDAPRASAELLAGEAFGMSRLGLIMADVDEQSAEACAHFVELVARRKKGEPVAYLLGNREFYGLDFRVGPQVLIPRPETEQIVELALAHFPADTELTFADFGTGSGILAVTLAHVFPRARGIAVDLSAAALHQAEENAQALGLAARLQFVRADMATPVLPPASCDLIVSNPPYVTEAEYAELSPEVRDHEPRMALVSPGDGLSHLRALLGHAALALKPGGLFLAEIGCGQGEAALRAVAAEAPALAEAAILKDYAGLDRVLRAQRIVA